MAEINYKKFRKKSREMAGYPAGKSEKKCNLYYEGYLISGCRNVSEQFAYAWKQDLLKRRPDFYPDVKKFTIEYL